MRWIAVALLVLASTLAPAAAAAGADYHVFYSERSSSFVAEGVAGEGDTRGYRFVVAQPNVTRVEFVLTWTETGDRTGLSRPDVFALRAEDPQGRAAGHEARSATGEARVERLSVNPLPRDQAVAADDLDAHVRATTRTDGTGEWRAWVKLEDAGNPKGARVDEENAFRLVAIVHYYEGVPMRVVSLEKPQGVPLAGDVPLWPWGAALAALASLACALAVALVAQARRRRALLSPPGENTPSPGR